MEEDFKVTVKDASESKVVSGGQPKTLAPPPASAPADQSDTAKKPQKKGGD